MTLDGIILFVNDVEKLKTFYMNTFSMDLVEETAAEWALLRAGGCSIGLHKAGKQYGIEPGQQNVKLVFAVTEDLLQIRSRLLQANVRMRELKTFDNYGYWLCDGEDPEGNMFQLKQKIP